MGDLAVDTAVRRVDGESATAAYVGSPAGDWAIWGPMGGYIACLALRAAGDHGGRARPASINVSYLAAAAFTEVDLDVTMLRTTRVATCHRVTMHQGGRLVLEALVWSTDADAGLEHHIDRPPPPVPAPETLPTFHQRVEAAGGEAPVHPFWRQIDMRPTHWIDDWDHREPLEPEQSSWYRFPGGHYDDPWLDACRVLIVTDLDAWGAATRRHVGPLEWFAPTIELTCRFLRPAPDDGWLLGWGAAPVGEQGLIGCESQTWDTGGGLVAIGGSTLLCRPAPTTAG